MIDRTNVGISPLMSTPITTTYLSTPGVEATSVIPGVQDATSYVTGSQTIISPGSIQATNPVLSTAGGLTGSMLPPVTSPEIVANNPLAQTTGSYVASNMGVSPLSPSLSQPTGYGTATMGATLLSPPISQPPTIIQAPPVPQSPLGPIMDEDFQRGRPIYDELFTEDRYRGFRLGR